MVVVSSRGMYCHSEEDVSDRRWCWLLAVVVIGGGLYCQSEVAVGNRRWWWSSLVGAYTVSEWLSWAAVVSVGGW